MFLRDGDIQLGKVLVHLSNLLSGTEALSGSPVFSPGRLRLLISAPRELFFLTRVCSVIAHTLRPRVMGRHEMRFPYLLRRVIDTCFYLRFGHKMWLGGFYLPSYVSLREIAGSL